MKKMEAKHSGELLIMENAWPFFRQDNTHIHYISQRESVFMLKCEPDMREPFSTELKTPANVYCRTKSIITKLKYILHMKY